MTAVTGAISRASASASPMPARIAAMKPSQPAQDGRPGSNASIHGSASQSNTSFRPNHSADQRQQRQAERLQEDGPEFRREQVAHGGAGSFEDHAGVPFQLCLDIGGEPANRKNRAAPGLH